MSLQERCKQKYCGVFNYAHEVYILYCYAYSPAQAREILFKRLADKHGVEVCRVRQLFDGSKDNMSIMVEVNFKEVEDDE
ncbi:MAG TPA: hypothetical protein ACFYD4_12705 [Candidatus Wunengus sp. YC61]|uniref:hypothetical protein n=1 Tax=Candidatus Wunengus sp. YC61 TaxID=3367698 RepID=UPI0040277756